MADKYHVLETDSVSQAQSDQINAAIESVDTTGVGVMLQEWSPDDNVHKITIGGETLPMDALKAAVNGVMGKDPDIDLETVRDTARVRTGVDCQAGNRMQITPWDFIKFNQASGNATSRRGQTWTANGTIAYQRPGPRANLPAIQFNSADAYFEIASPPGAYNPGNKEFAVEFWVYQLTRSTQEDQMLIDYNFQDGAGNGFAIWLNENAGRIGLTDGTNVHVTQFQHGGQFWQEERWRRFGWAVKRDEEKCRLFVDDNELTTTALLGGGRVPLNQVGTISASGPIRIGSRAHVNGADTWVFDGRVAAMRFSKITD